MSGVAVLINARKRGGWRKKGETAVTHAITTTSTTKMGAVDKTERRMRARLELVGAPS